MKEGETKKHESYGMISIGKFNSNGTEFFGSDILQSGGITIQISKASVKRDLHREWYHAEEDIIEIQMSANQYVDAITSGMNTSGVPCTIKAINGKYTEKIPYIIDKKEQFSGEMANTQNKYLKRIDDIMEMLLEGNVGKRKKEEICQELKVLRNHLKANTNFVLKSFNEAMEESVLEAKQSIGNYIDHKVHTLGIEGLREQLKVSLESNQDKELEE